MLKGKTFLIVVLILTFGFTVGFFLRPIMMPPIQTTVATTPLAAPPQPTQPRSAQYFAAKLDDARRIMAGCSDGSVRGEECANAQQAVTEAEGRDRFKKFMDH